MPVGQFQLVNTGKEALLTDNANQVSWASDTIVAALLDASYTPSASHSTWADVSANHVVGTNYAPVTLTGKTSARTGGTLLWDSADIAFGANVTVTAKYCAIFQQAGGSLTSTDKFLGYVDLDTTNSSATVSSTNSTFTVGTPNGLFDV